MGPSIEAADGDHATAVDSYWGLHTVRAPGLSQP